MEKEKSHTDRTKTCSKQYKPIREKDVETGENCVLYRVTGNMHAVKTEHHVDTNQSGANKRDIIRIMMKVQSALP